MMKVRILFFSILQDLTGSGEIEQELSGDQEWKVSDLLEMLYQKYEGLREWDGKILVAVEREYVDRDRILADGEEIAVMPPVQGG